MSAKVLEGEHVMYAVPHRTSKNANDLLLACWHLDRWSRESTTVYVLRDEQDWLLFRIANAITSYRAAVLGKVRKNID